MYTEDCLSVSVADNGGFLVRLHVMRKKEKSAKGEIGMVGYPGSDDKLIVAKDEADLVSVIKKALPMMKPGGMEEDEFKKCFGESCTEGEAGN